MILCIFISKALIRTGWLWGKILQERLHCMGTRGTWQMESIQLDGDDVLFGWARRQGVFRVNNGTPAWYIVCTEAIATSLHMPKKSFPLFSSSLGPGSVTGSSFTTGRHLSTIGSCPIRQHSARAGHVRSTVHSMQVIPHRALINLCTVLSRLTIRYDSRYSVPWRPRERESLPLTLP